MMAPNQVVPIWLIKRQRPGGAKMAFAITTLRMSNKEVLSWHIYMKVTQMGAHHFCKLRTTNLTSKLCAESCTNALTIPYSELSEIDQNLNSKSSFCLLGTFFGAGSYILEKFHERFENSREFLRKKKLNYLTSP